MAQPAIEIKDLSFTYGKQMVLSQVDLHIRHGDFVAFLGPNGGGKSSLLKLCLGLLQTKQGSIKILGHKINGNRGQVLSQVGYVPQEFQGTEGFPVTVQDLVLTGRLMTGRFSWRWSREDQNAAQKALEMVGLWHRKGWRLNQLSGGQRQRVMIARAMAAEPELLLLDEPVASVDPEWQAKLFDLFKELNRNCTIVMVSHDLTAISSYIKSVVCINQRVHYHPKPEITAQMLSETYCCPVELIAHGLPHRVLAGHDDHEEHHA